MSSLENTHHILWHSDDHSIYLLDGPASIINAQGLGPEDKSYNLLSTTPISKPFISQEPTSQKARQRLLSTASAQELHEKYAKLLEDALSQVKDASPGLWLSPRAVQETSHGWIEQTMLGSATCYTQLVSAGENCTIQNNWPFVSNTHSSMTEAVIGQSKLHFFIPSRSTFMLADCTDRRSIASLHSNVRSQANDAGTPWKFDCLVIDPPWSNRSVKRKRSSYKTADGSQIVAMLYAMDVDRLMSVDCLVGVWITNKQSVRETVIGEDGLFQTWGVDLVEEWIWLKVTTQGEPISALEALWRKPYEVLLLGRRRDLVRPQKKRPSQTKSACQRS